MMQRYVKLFELLLAYEPYKLADSTDQHLMNIF